MCGNAAASAEHPLDRLTLVIDTESWGGGAIPDPRRPTFKTNDWQTLPWAFFASCNASIHRKDLLVAGFTTKRSSHTASRTPNWHTDCTRSACNSTPSSTPCRFTSRLQTAMSRRPETDMLSLALPAKASLAASSIFPASILTIACSKRSWVRNGLRDCWRCEVSARTGADEWQPRR